MLFYSPTTYGSDRFRQIFSDHWDHWLDMHREDIPLISELTFTGQSKR